MGKKSKQTSTNEPSQFAKGYITPAANALQDTYNANQPGVQGIANQFQAQLPDFINSSFQTSPLMASANGYANDVLGGKYLNAGNPYLENMIDQTDRSVSNRVNSTFGAAGRTGGGAHTQVLGQSLADAQYGLRSADYNNQLSRMDGVLGQASGLEAARYAAPAAALGIASGAASLPYIGSGAYANGIGGLVGQYNTQTKTSQDSGFNNIMKYLGTAAQAASAFSDRRLKDNIERVGELPDGLGVYDYDYIWGGDRQRGVMADEVAELRPWALGPTVAGYATVNYGAL